MKRISICLLIISLYVNIFSMSSVWAASNQKDRNEILVKYSDESEITSGKSRLSFIEKFKPRKFDSKKIINVDNTKLEVIEISKNDDSNDVAEKMAQQPNVEFAVPNHIIKLIKEPMARPKDPIFNLQWGLNNEGQIIYGQAGKKGIDIDALKAWTLSKGRSNVIVGVLDTGIDINHEDLKNNILVNKRDISGNEKDDDRNGYVDDVRGWDFANDDSTIYDSPYNDAHGTHVAGIIAAEDNNTGVVGVAPNVRILPLKFIDNDIGYVSDVIEAIEYGKKMGIKIFNCSWSMPERNKALEFEMRTSDAVFVCAAGNYGNNVLVSPVYPACFNLDNIISVAAINNQGKLAYFSNYGRKIDVAAPGEGIISTIPENEYMFADGTSMAAPFVSGIAALLRSKGITNSKEIVHRIKTDVDKDPLLRGYVATGGFVNAYQSLMN